MLRFVLRRAASAALTLLGVLALVFGLLAAAPGDPARMAAGSTPRALSPEALAAFRSLYGLDRPALERFGLWIVRAARFDFGRSLSDGRPVTARIAAALPATLTLNLSALLLALALGVPAGIGAARRPGGPLDRISGALGDALFATPSFVLGLVLLLVFSGALRWTPLFSDTGGFRGYVLPVVTLALPTAAFLARFVRACVVAALANPSAAAGRARGEGKRSRREAGAPALGCAVRGAGGRARPVLSCPGSVLVERVFSLPGAGGLLADAVFARDVPTVLALTLLSAGAVVAASFLAELVSDSSTRERATPRPRSPARERSRERASDPGLPGGRAVRVVSRDGPPRARPRARKALGRDAHGGHAPERPRAVRPRRHGPRPPPAAAGPGPRPGHRRARTRRPRADAARRARLRRGGPSRFGARAPPRRRRRGRGGMDGRRRGPCRPVPRERRPGAPRARPRRRGSVLPAAVLRHRVHAHRAHGLDRHGARRPRRGAESPRGPVRGRGAGRGASGPRLVLVHVLPHALGPALALLPYTLGAAVLTEAALSFLGLGAPPPEASWGRALAEARRPPAVGVVVRSSSGGRALPARPVGAPARRRRTNPPSP